MLRQICCRCQPSLPDFQTHLHRCLGACSRVMLLMYCSAFCYGKYFLLSPINKFANVLYVSRAQHPFLSFPLKLVPADTVGGVPMGSGVAKSSRARPRHFLSRGKSSSNYSCKLQMSSPPSQLCKILLLDGPAKDKQLFVVPCNILTIISSPCNPQTIFSYSEVGVRSYILCPTACRGY